MLIIGIAGGTGSGKTTVVNKIVSSFKPGEVVVIPQDSYYKDSNLPLEERLKQNFDHPDSIDFDLLNEQIEDLRNGKTIQQPVYSYLTCSRSKTETVTVNPAHIIIIEGILIFTNPKLRSLLDIKFFVDADADERLLRVIQRDVLERGRTVKMVMDRYVSTLKPMHLQFIEPSKRYADIIIPQGGNNNVAIDFLTAIIEKQLSKFANK
ncbi:MAG: uridine kinase [Bacteroidales bacterium]